MLYSILKYTIIYRQKLYICNMKKIKIPKVEFDKWLEIKKTQTTRYQIVLKKQELEGLIIPNGSTINIDVEGCEFNSTGNKILVPAYNVNVLLRFVYMELLRKGEI